MSDTPTKDRLYLKWGTLKGYDAKTEPFRAALQAYMDAGDFSCSAMMQHDTDAQVEALCAAIDACEGPIINEWEGRAMTRDQAKAYIREYPREQVHGKRKAAQ